MSVCAGEIVQRDDLIEELDLVHTTQDTVNALHAHIRRLRRWLNIQGVPPSTLQTAGRSGYRLNIQKQDVDAYAFIEQVNRVISRQTQTPATTVPALEGALAAWRGVPLQHMAESVRVQSLARQLDTLQELARELLLEGYLALRMYQKAAVAAEQFSLEAPYNERIWGSRIVALRMGGRRADAACVFRHVQKVLHDELRVAPSHSLHAALTDARWEVV